LGNLCGIEDRFNLCGDTLEESLARMEAVREDIIVPALEKSGSEFYNFSTIAMDGVWCFYPRFEFTSFLYFTKRLVGVPGYHYFQSEAHEISNEQNIKSLSRYSRFRLFTFITYHQYLKKFFLTRWMINLNFMITDGLLKILPIFGIWKFGYKKAYVKI
jgi:hypothetical protein